VRRTTAAAACGRVVPLEGPEYRVLIALYLEWRALGGWRLKNGAGQHAFTPERLRAFAQLEERMHAESLRLAEAATTPSAAD
jgi:hypothetical protein